MIRKILPILLLLSLSLVHSQPSIPLVSTPVEINGLVNYTNQSSFAVYEIYLSNPTLSVFNYYFTTISYGWLILYGENNNLERGIIYPNRTIAVDIYLRPITFTQVLPTSVLVFYNSTNSYSYTLYFTPYVLYYTYINSTAIAPLQINLFVQNKTVLLGSYVNFYIYVNNTNSQSQAVNIELYTDWGYKKDIYLLAGPGISALSLSIMIPSSLRENQTTFTFIINNQTYQFNITILAPSYIPEIIEENGKIIIINNSSFAITYSYIINESSGGLLFNLFSPFPNKIIRYPNGIYSLEYDIVLLPGEKFVITISPNYLLYASIILLLLLIILLIIQLLLPRVYIRKEVIRVNPKEGTAHITLSIVNNSLFSVNNVSIIDKIGKDLEIANYEIRQPENIYKNEEGTTIEWKYDKIERKEEIVVSYILKLPKDKNEIEIDRALIKYNYLFLKNREEKSNRLVIRILG